MSTKSFTTDFKINKKTSIKLTDALANSRRVDHQINQKVETLTDKDQKQKMMYQKSKLKVGPVAPLLLPAVIFYAVEI